MVIMGASPVELFQDCFFLIFEQPSGQMGFVDPDKESRVEEMLQWMCFHSPGELQLQCVGVIPRLCSRAAIQAWAAWVTAAFPV